MVLANVLVKTDFGDGEDGKRKERGRCGRERHNILLLGATPATSVDPIGTTRKPVFCSPDL